MTKKRPVGVMVFAILNVIFGVLGVFGGLCSGISMLANTAIQSQAAQMQKGPSPVLDPVKLQKDMEARVPGYVAIQWVQVVLGMVLSCVLITCGIGLFTMGNWARKLTIAYCVISMLVHLGYTVHNIVVVRPAIDEAMLQQPMHIPGWVFVGFALLIGLVSITYAVVMLIYMAMPGTARAFSAGAGEMVAGPYGDFDEREMVDPRD